MSKIRACVTIQLYISRKSKYPSNVGISMLNECVRVMAKVTTTEQYPVLRSVAKILLTVFPSTYLSNFALSHMNFIMNKFG